jgi:prepilin-type N-terminal cleavage/methylation domain-containing protein
MDRRDERAPQNRRGFTLLEILIVLVIMSTLLTLSVPRIDIARHRADGAAQIVRTALQLAQRNALTRQHDMLVSFDTVRQRIRIAYDANNDGILASSETITWRGLNDGARFASPPAGMVYKTGGPVRGGGIRTIGGMPTISFRRDGAASGDVELYFRGGPGRPKDFRVIAIVQATGRADWYRYNGTVWSPGGF